MSNLSGFESLIYGFKQLMWGGPLLIVLFGVGLYMTLQLQGLQFRKLGHALSLLAAPFGRNKSTAAGEVGGDIPSFQSLMTALAGSIGTGNITGIAAAVVTGGLGALFWMWVMAFVGMATAYSETLLGVKYREKNAKGYMSGGPMYTLLHGLKSKRIATLYALLGGFATIGIGCMVQSNSMVDAVASITDTNRFLMGSGLALLVGLVIIGGVRSIGRVAGILVPFMAIAYLAAGIFVLMMHNDRIFEAFHLIIQSAFTGQAAVGGFLGSTIMMALQSGVQFGVFANEAGLGSLSIAGASAQVKKPAEQGMMAISGVFISTMIVCTITGLVLVVTQVIGTEIDGHVVSGSPLAMMAFASVHTSLQIVVLLGLNLFAFTTMLGWAYYGEKCFEFLLGVYFVPVYRWLFIIGVVLGAVMELNLVWAIANIASGLMALPNLYAVFKLSDVVKAETHAYLQGEETVAYKQKFSY